MGSIDLCYLSVKELSRLIQNKEISPVELIKVHLSRIEALEPTLNSFITLLPEKAMAAAKRAEEEIQKGKYRGPLHGIPLGLKDLFYVKGIRNTFGSKIFDHFTPNMDSTIYQRLKKAGAILLGKLNLHQFAYGTTGENPDYGHMHNPWDTELIAGGSSGGSGSAVVSGECTLAMGSDSGGSIRIPGALCGLVGLKPTYGRLSRYGLNVLSWSLDHPGPMARTVQDCALMMNAIAGYDSKDSTSSKNPLPDFTEGLTGDIRNLRIGVPKEYFEVPIDPQVKKSVILAIDQLGKLGANIFEISWPMYHYAKVISNIILTAEATACYSKLIRTHGSNLYPPVRLRLEAGFFISAKDYIQGQQARNLFCQKSKDLFNAVDLVAGPTVPITACRISETEVDVGGVRMEVVPALTQYTRPFNINGFPAITLPCGFSENGLPIGLQLAGLPFHEKTVLRAAHAYEKVTPWHKQRPQF
jgi:aspartyl-tRNA(Asn)/glutamyl-tRNA(Gln) amidotransferase subunit A